jgi:hypothetical protein
MLKLRTSRLKGDGQAQTHASKKYTVLLKNKKYSFVTHQNDNYEISRICMHVTNEKQ